MAYGFDRYAEALGLWTLPKEQPEDDPVDLKLKMGDGKKLRDILMDERNKKEKGHLFKRFEDFMFELIKRDHSGVEDDTLKRYIEMNIMVLFESAQITFRYTTQEDLDKAKREVMGDLKKSIGGN